MAALFHPTFPAKAGIQIDPTDIVVVAMHLARHPKRSG